MYDTAFRSAEQQISNDIVEKKFKLGQNSYWGHVRDEGMFPLKSGTRIKKIRLSRIGFGEMTTGWRNVEDNGCFSNVCSEPDAEVISHGSEESFYSLETFKISTDDICLALLPFRQMAERELSHFEAHLKLMSQYFWNEYLRSRYIHTSENKYVAMVNDSALASGDICDTLERNCSPHIEDSDGFMFMNRGENGPVFDSTLPIDERYVVVKIPVSKIPNISELSADLLDIASQNLEFEDENKPWLNDGIELFDVIVPDPKVARRLAQLERIQESECMPNVMFSGKELGRNLGIKRVIRESYGIRRDVHGMKFYPDNDYNAGLSAFSPADPETWPRFVRVFAYKPQRNANGTIKYVPNKAFQFAPFGISVIFTTTVMGMRHHPDAQSIGTAKVGETARNYAGNAVWVNEYDKKCNPKREIGHWELHFGAGIEPDRPELGNVFFHRLDHSVSLSAVPCNIPILGCNDGGMTPYCYSSVQSGEAALGVSLGDRGANMVAVDNSRMYFI